MIDQLPPNVCIDGNAVRRIREEKKLTQLYVAKVVGVTTDTISRWENNRYPTIKRDNVLKLAEALEAEVDEILSIDNPLCENLDEETNAEVGGRRWGAIFLLAGFFIAVVTGFLWWYLTPVNPPLTIKAKRFLPTYAAPGTEIPVQVQIDREGGEGGFILREHFPKGWKLIESIPPASSLDNVEGSARWIVRPGDHRTLFAYLLRVENPDKDGEVLAFHGEVVAGPGDNSRPVPVQGAEKVKVGPFLWADLNGDQKIDDVEMLQAADWVDQMKGLHLDWGLLEKVWDAGGYRWDGKKKIFVPEKPAERPPENEGTPEPG